MGCILLCANRKSIKMQVNTMPVSYSVRKIKRSKEKQTG